MAHIVKCGLSRSTSTMSEGVEYRPLLEGESEYLENVKYVRESSKPRWFYSFIKGSLLGLLITSAIDYYKFEIEHHAKEGLNEIKQLIPMARHDNLPKYLFDTTRVLCVVMTSKAAYRQRGFNITDTWGKRCNKILFFSDDVGERMSSGNL